jgi:hypothetical protein
MCHRKTLENQTGKALSVWNSQTVRSTVLDMLTFAFPKSGNATPLSPSNQLTSFRIANRQTTDPEYFLGRAQSALDGAVHVALPFTARVFTGKKDPFPGKPE